MAEWERAIRQEPWPVLLKDSALQDDLPDFLDQLAASMRAEHAPLGGDIGGVTEALMGERVSRSTVSRVTKSLDGKVRELRNAPIAGPIPYLFLDATFLDARWARTAGRGAHARRARRGSYPLPDALGLDARAATDHNSLVSDRVSSWLPDWAQAVAAGLLQPIVLTLLVSVSVSLFALSLIGLPLVLKRMPTDFFSRPERRRLRLAERRRPFWYIILRGLKNALGCVLLALGVLMLFVPGQGLVTILVALFLIDLPGKRRLQRWAISRPAVHRPVNALRRRSGRPPFELPLRS